jgi:glycosyltransferase involved in cell wall biosynthesis
MHISVVIPAYNEEQNIEKVARNAVSIISGLTKEYEVLIVDDGSTDNTGEIIRRLSKENKHIRSVHHERNYGAGAALKTCYTNAKGDLIFFIPADGQVPANEIHKLYPHIEQADIIVGNRKERADPLHRRINARLYSTLIWLLFGLNVKDVDGVKLFKKKVFENIHIESNSAFVEAEILIKAQGSNFKILEIPVNHYPRIGGQQTGANLKVIANALWEVVKFRFNY